MKTLKKLVCPECKKHVDDFYFYGYKLIAGKPTEVYTCSNCDGEMVEDDLIKYNKIKK